MSSFKRLVLKFLGEKALINILQLGTILLFCV